MASARDSFADLEKHRQLLEDNVAKLRKSLQHWRRWDAEYELLKEEIEALPTPVTSKDLTRIRAEFESDVIEGKEIDDIFGRVGVRPAEQIVGVLTRRIDYVTQNIETIQKQLDAAEDKLAAVEVVSQPDVRDEEGLPITEIIEELDEEGNVVSHRLQRPGDSSAQLEEALKKAGVQDLPRGTPPAKRVVEDVTEKTPSTSKVVSPASASTPPKAAQTAAKKPSVPASQPRAPSERAEKVPAKAPADETKPRYQSISLSDLAADDDNEPEDASSQKKSVSFTEDTKPGEEIQKSRTARRVEEIMQTAKQQELLARETAIIPEGESEEDAFLRGEMLKYGMEEVGAVVAELTLEEGTDDEDEGFDEIDESDDDDDEDKYGRYTGSFFDDDYRQRMLELEKKLGVKSRFTEEMQDDDDDDDDAKKGPEGLGRIVISREASKAPMPSSREAAEPSASALKSSASSSSVDSAAKGKKSVSFANELDIAPDEVEPAPTPAPVLERKAPIVEPLSDIVERTGPSKRTDPSKKPKRVSRFKQEQAATPGATDDFVDVPKGPLDMPARFLDQDRPIAPSGPEGRTLAESVLERESAPRAQDMDGDANDEFVDLELADEYYRKRREFIHRHGGFLKEDESPIRPLDEADGGRKISKFKAARLSKQ